MSAPKFKAGDRVTGVFWGRRKTGTVLRTSSVAWVQWDGEARETWAHFDSLSAAEGRTP